MPKNKIEDLRNLLFETMERLMDDDDKMDVDRARAVAQVGSAIVETGKAELQYLQLVGRGRSSFIEIEPPEPPEPVARLAAAPPPPALSEPIEISPDDRHEDLCQKCVLPDCDESSDKCLVRIQRKAA